MSEPVSQFVENVVCVHRWTVDGIGNPRADQPCDHCGLPWRDRDAMPEAGQEVKPGYPVLRLTVELTSIEGQQVNEYNFTTENCTQEQLQAFRCQLAMLLALVGKVPAP